MCKKMAHSAQLNIKVDPLFSVGLSVGWLSVFLILLDAGCPGLGWVSFRWIVFCRRGPVWGWVCCRGWFTSWPGLVCGLDFLV